jgi:hypothetical protein
VYQGKTPLRNGLGYSLFARVQYYRKINSGWAGILRERGKISSFHTTG